MNILNSFGNKLLIKVLGVTTFIFIVTMYFVSSYSYIMKIDNSIHI